MVVVGNSKKSIFLNILLITHIVIASMYPFPTTFLYINNLHVTFKYSIYNSKGYVCIDIYRKLNLILVTRNKSCNVIRIKEKSIG